MKNKNENAPKKKNPARFVDFVAFVALILAAVLLVLAPILNHFLDDGGVKTLRIVTTVAQYLLIAAVALPAWYFVRRKGQVFQIVYFVCLLVYVAGTVLGYTL